MPLHPIERETISRLGMQGLNFGAFLPPGNIVSLEGMKEREERMLGPLPEEEDDFE